MDEKNQVISDLKFENSEKDKAILELRKELNNISTSKSWTITKPLRKITTFIKELMYRFKIKTRPNDVSNFEAYDSIYQDDMDFKGYKTDIKALAFYLPQFHTFKENDEWWGKGFTEWTNAKKAKPRYKDHYQPRLPHDDFGFYDLSDIKVLKKQAELAKKHGLYGFCFYYYWFSGKRLMEKPVDMLLEHPEIDINFCLCWANENWTRKWDGKNNDVLIAQEYTFDDPKKFIEDIKKYIDDKRYIKVDGQPVIMIYNPSIIPNVETVIEKWREEARNQGIGEIKVWTRNLITDDATPVMNSDAEFDFAPLEKGTKKSVLSGPKNSYIFNYRMLVDEINQVYRRHRTHKPFYYTSTMGWDNSSRRMEGYNVLHSYNLKKFYEWNSNIINITRERYNEDERFMFINAWNEWCEGTYLEPDQKYGYANINTLSKALFDIPFDNVELTTKKEKNSLKNEKKIAVQIHLYHDDLSEEIKDQLDNIPYSFDCFVTTDKESKKRNIKKVLSKIKNVNKLIIDITNNRGRDVAPFIIQMSNYYQDYDYICHIHTKKSLTVEYGDGWRKYLYNNLFGSTKHLEKIFSLFENNSNLGVIYPEMYPVISLRTKEYGRNLEMCKQMFKKLGIPNNYINNDLVFPAGTMFWAKVDAIKPLFSIGLTWNDFAKEAGQLDATPAHAVERIICSLAKSRGYTYQKVLNCSIDTKLPKKKRLILFAHYSQDGNISSDDVNYINKLETISKDIIFITGTNTKKKEIDKIKDKTLKIITNDEGFDFGAWSKALNDKDTLVSKYDEVVFANNSCIITNMDFNKMFDMMNTNDIVGLTYTSLNGNKEVLYLKSDFMIFSSNSLKNNDIKNFFSHLKTTKNIQTKKEMQNVLLTRLIENSNLKYDVLIGESKYIDKYLVKTPFDLKNPYLMLVLGSPLINKSSLIYIDEDEKKKVNYIINKLK